MDNMRKNTIVAFLLDESGSMSRVRHEAVTGLNEYIDTLKGDPSPTSLRLTTFNSNRTRVIFDFQDVQAIEKISNHSYRPDCATPLLDNIAWSILATDNYLKGRLEELDVMFTIMTDGLENASSSFTRSEVSLMIKARESEGWMFTYLGANQNARAEGRRMGIKSKYAATYEYDNPKEAMRIMAESTMRAKAGWKETRNAKDFFTEIEKLRLLEKRSK